MNCPFRFAPKSDAGDEEEDLTFRFEERYEKEIKCDVRLAFVRELNIFLFFAFPLFLF